MKNRTFARMAVILAVIVVGWSVVAATIGTSTGSTRGPSAGPTDLGRSGQADATTGDPSLDPDPTLTTTAPGVTPVPTATPSRASVSPATKVRSPTPGPAARPTPGPTARPTPRPTARPTPRPTQSPSSGWVVVVDDTFAAGRVPGHWSTYDGPYGSGPHNCAAPSHVVVSGGVLHLLLSYESVGAGSAGCGPGWYSGGISLSGYSSVDQQVTVRFRVVRNGVAGHFIVPMRWPDDQGAWPAAGEEDYCETDATNACSTFLHYSSGNRQIDGSFAVDMTQWHTIRTERRDHRVRIFVDDMTHPVWTYVGTSSTLPDTLKHVVIQQECELSCPGGTAGSEDIQIDRITVADPN